MIKKNVLFKNANINLPNELYIAMKYPLLIVIKRKTKDNFGIYNLLDYCKISKILIIKDFINFCTKKSNLTFHLAILTKKKGSHVQFKLIKSINKLSNDEYRIINYHPMYYLAPIVEKPDEDSTINTWATINDYHEHLVVSQQDKLAIRMSEWLASEVIKPFKPKKILELGCGAGRNLLAISKHIPNALLFGVDINEKAIQNAKNVLPKNVKLITGSIYDELNTFEENSIDVVFTSGVLMHIPHNKVKKLILKMNQVAKKGVIHRELHGPSNIFDYHRYPRDYKNLYNELGVSKNFNYEILPRNDYRGKVNSFNLSLLIARKTQ